MADEVLDRLNLPALLLASLYALTIRAKKNFSRVKVIVLKRVVIDVVYVFFSPVVNLLQVHASKNRLL